MFSYFGPWVCLKVSLVITLVVHPCVSPYVLPFVFRYLRDCLLIYYYFLHGARAPSVRVRSERAQFLSKNLGGSLNGETLHPAIRFFWNFMFIRSSTLSSTLWKPHVGEKSGSDCIVWTTPLFGEFFFLI